MRVEQLSVFLNFDLHVEIQNDDLLAVKYFKPTCIFFLTIDRSKAVVLVLFLK